MGEVFNNKQSKRLRRKLRANTTTTESLLWSRLRNRQILNLKFRRQYSILNYIVDFYCPELNLALEVDGDTHCNESARLYDASRTREIESLGVKIIRFTNNDIYENLDGVIETIISNGPLLDWRGIK